MSVQRGRVETERVEAAIAEEFASNADYVADLLRQFERDPSSIVPSPVTRVAQVSRFGGFARLSLVFATPLLVLVVLCSCGRFRKTESTVEQSDGEPTRYSATVVRTVSDGMAEQTTVTRVVRDGEIFRQEWTEGGERRALIWRPDVGKVLTLSLDRSVYTESSIDSGLTSPTRQANSGSGEGTSDSSLDEQAINHAFGGPPDPDSVDLLNKSGASVGGYNCSVTEQRATFADGHIEVTRIYRAVELGGLAVRIESEGPGQRGPARVVTELRDVMLDVSDKEFAAPEQFRRVDRL